MHNAEQHSNVVTVEMVSGKSTKNRILFRAIFLTFDYLDFSLLPAKMCWDLMKNVIKGPQSMMMYKGRGRVAAG